MFFLQDGVLVENMFDIPYVKPNQAGPELTSFMTRVCTEVKRILPSLPCGVQILAGNNKSALAVAAAAGNSSPLPFCKNQCVE